MEQLSGLDAAFVYAETAGPAHVTFFAIYDPGTAVGATVRFADIAAHIGARLGTDRIFRSVLARVPFDLDHPYWVRDRHFDLGNHLHHLTLPEPGGWRQLCDQVAALHAQPMDLSRPVWECYYIDGLGVIKGVPRNAFALCVKAHHSAVDGVTGLSVVNALHDLTPEPAPAPADDWSPEPRPSRLNLLARTAATYARRSAQLASAVGGAAPLLTRLPAAAVSRLRPDGEPDTQQSLAVPDCPFNGHTDRTRNFDARSYDLASVLAVRELVPGATVNDVVLTGIGGAMRHYLQAKGMLPETSLVSAMAIEIHDDDKHHRGVNQISVVRVPVGTDLADPIARLEAVRDATAASKAANEGVGRRVLEYAEFLPGEILVPAIRLGMAMHLGKLSEMLRVANTLVSSMRGPEVPIYLAGAQMHSGYALSPFTQGGALLHNVISYRGRVTVSINGCATALPDIGDYADCMDASFAEMLPGIRWAHPPT